jgi:hypothetical protein
LAAQEAIMNPFSTAEVKLLIFLHLIALRGQGPACG